MLVHFLLFIYLFIFLLEFAYSFSAFSLSDITWASCELSCLWKFGSNGGKERAVKGVQIWIILSLKCIPLLNFCGWYGATRTLVMEINLLVFLLSSAVNVLTPYFIFNHSFNPAKFHPFFSLGFYTYGMEKRFIFRNIKSKMIVTYPLIVKLGMLQSDGPRGFRSLALINLFIVLICGHNPFHVHTSSPNICIILMTCYTLQSLVRGRDNWQKRILMTFRCEVSNLGWNLIMEKSSNMSFSHTGLCG